MLGITHGVEVASLSNHGILRTYVGLIWDDSRGNKTNLSQIHGGNLHLMHVNLEKVTSYTKHVFHERDMKIMLTKVSNTSLMFNRNHGEDKDVVDGINNNLSRFPWRWNSITMWTR